MRNRETLLLKYAALTIIGLTLASCNPNVTGPANPTTRVASPEHHAGKRTSKFSTLSTSTEFIVDNESSQTLGIVTISDIDQSVFLNVGATEVDSTLLPFAAVSVTIDSQVCAYPDTLIASLPNGAKVHESWTSPGIIAIINYRQQN